MKKILKTMAFAASFSVLAAASASAAVVSETFASPFIVDNNSGTYSFNVAAGQTISDINITIDFTKCNDPLVSSTCGVSGNSFNREIVFMLISPLMTVVNLVLQDTYSGQNPGDRVSVTFDDQAATVVGGPTLQTGTFRPVGSLADFIGENSAGTWSIFYQDTVGADPLAFNGYSLQINGPAAVPLPASLPLLAAALGAFGLVRRRRSNA